ncbi:MAG TPA: XdhC family protein [Gemmatimonadaceae bacterium]
MNDILERVSELRASRTPFVLATVVASYPPQSVRAGAKAVVLADGALEGWIGGGCIRPIVLDEAREALASGRPRLVRMNAGGEGDNAHPGVRVHPMTCQGEGGLEIYLEPMLPAPRLCVLGETPVAQALRSLAGEVGHVTVAIPNDADAVVVATMGVGDEDALAAAASSGAAYVGLVASRKKARFLFDYLRACGVPNESLERVKAPAGLDLGGMTAGEIALSILAEIVQRRHTADRHPAERSDEGSAFATGDEGARAPTARASSDERSAVDPICGMTVDRATAKHTLEFGGETYYFCCPHCKASFAKAHA